MQPGDDHDVARSPQYPRLEEPGDNLIRQEPRPTAGFARRKRIRPSRPTDPASLVPCFVKGGEGLNQLITHPSRLRKRRVVGPDHRRDVPRRGRPERLSFMSPIRGPVYASGGGDFIHVAPQVIEGDITWLFAVNVQPVEVIEQAVGVGLLSRWSVPLEQVQCISVNLAIRRKYPVRLASVLVRDPTNAVSVLNHPKSSRSPFERAEHTFSNRSPRIQGGSPRTSRTASRQSLRSATMSANTPTSTRRSSTASPNTMSWCPSPRFAATTVWWRSATGSVERSRRAKSV